MAEFTCTKCGQEMDISFKSSSGNWCKQCKNESQKERRAKLREKQKDVIQGEPVNIPTTEQIETGPQLIPEPKKTTTKKEVIPKADIKAIKSYTTIGLQTAFGIIASRAGDHWNISKDEAGAVADPLINILNKYDFFKTVTKNSDAVGLVMAVGMIIIPRTLNEIEIQRIKKKAKKEVKEIHGSNKPQQEEIKNIGIIRENKGSSPSNNPPISETNDRQSFGAAIL